MREHHPRGPGTRMAHLNFLIISTWLVRLPGKRCHNFRSFLHSVNHPALFALTSSFLQFRRFPLPRPHIHHHQHTHSTRSCRPSSWPIPSPSLNLPPAPAPGGSDPSRCSSVPAPGLAFSAVAPASAWGFLVDSATASPGYGPGAAWTQRVVQLLVWIKRSP